MTAQKLRDKRKTKDAYQAFNQRTCWKIKYTVFNPWTSTAVPRAVQHHTAKEEPLGLQETSPFAWGWDKWTTELGATLYEGLFRDIQPAESRVSTGIEESNAMIQLPALALLDHPIASSWWPRPFQQGSSDNNSWQSDCVASERERDESVISTVLDWFKPIIKPCPCC